VCNLGDTPAQGARLGLKRFLVGENISIPPLGPSLPGRDLRSHSRHDLAADSSFVAVRRFRLATHLLFCVLAPGFTLRVSFTATVPHRAGTGRCAADIRAAQKPSDEHK
jgi:hypothetical protein